MAEGSLFALPLPPFKCNELSLDKATNGRERENWLRAFEIYTDAERITDTTRKRSKLLYLDGTQLQEVAYTIPGAIVNFDAARKNDVYTPLVKKLTAHFSPKQNSTFERHVFRTTKPTDGESFDKFLLKIRQLAMRCTFGTTPQEAMELNLKDKIINAWAPKELKKKLLEKERSLSEVIELCQVRIEKKEQSNQEKSLM